MTRDEADEMLDMWLTEGVLRRRLFAALIDAFMIAVLVAGGWVFCLVFGLLTLGLGWMLFVLLPAIPFAYHVLSVAGIGATPGQAVTGLAVRRIDDLGPPTMLQAVISTVGYYVTLAAGGLPFLVVLITRGKRTLHDIASGLVVVRSARIATPPLTSPASVWNMPGDAWHR
jgi:uncharacterized RDD family membrane protein YckC